MGKHSPFQSLHIENVNVSTFQRDIDLFVIVGKSEPLAIGRPTQVRKAITSLPCTGEFADRTPEGRYQVNAVALSVRARKGDGAAIWRPRRYDTGRIISQPYCFLVAQLLNVQSCLVVMSLFSRPPKYDLAAIRREARRQFGTWIGRERHHR